MKDTKTLEPQADNTTEGGAVVAWESMVVLRMNRKVSPIKDRCWGVLVMSPVMMVMQKGKETKLFCHLHKQGVGCSVEAEGEVHVLPSPCTDLLLPVELLISQPFYLKSGNSACSSIALNKNQSVTLSIYHVKK